ncbi:MAG: class I SAM-dependent methyltransferase [Planctomycetaceae bacterium]
MVESAQELIAAAFAQNRCLKLVLSDRRREAPEAVSKVTVRPVRVAGRSVWQFTSHFRDRVTHANVDAVAAARRVERLLHETFQQAALFTAEADLALRVGDDGHISVARSPATMLAADTLHDRSKTYLIPEGKPCAFLAEIGVMTPAGSVRRAMYHKFRQINRYLELVQDVVPALPTDRELHVVDYGCGKSYLTFALHHLLTVVHQRSVRLVGLDLKADVIRRCRDLAQRLDCRGLEFREGDLALYADQTPIDLSVSLHACDTATDLALAQAIRRNATVILAVPCCQHELASRICNAELGPLSRHGILHDRLAALATDALRALVLETYGYATQVVEFIDLEHTAKNVLLRAVRRTRIDPELRETYRRELQAFQKLLGIDGFCLEGELAGS